MPSLLIFRGSRFTVGASFLCIKYSEEEYYHITCSIVKLITWASEFHNIFGQGFKFHWNLICGYFLDSYRLRLSIMRDLLLTEVYARKGLCIACNTVIHLECLFCTETLQAHIRH
jgi:hypothetical protein